MTRPDFVRKEGAPGIELQDPSRDTAGLSSAQAVKRQCPMWDRRDVHGGEEGPYYLTPGVGVELADVELDVVSSLVRPDVPTVVLQRSNAPGDEFHPNHGPRDAGLSEVTDPWVE
jgi:hypothetical protein